MKEGRTGRASGAETCRIATSAGPRRAEGVAVRPQHGGESTAAWRQFLEDLGACGRARPEFGIVAPAARVPHDGAMLLRALLASGQITMRKVDGWRTLAKPIAPIPLDHAA